MPTPALARLNRKTVYILGAGFSIPAGAPSQAGIMPEILKLPPTAEVEARRKVFADFLKINLNAREDALPRIALEDIYTPIDRCIADGTSLRGKSPDQLIEIRGAIDFLISSAIAHHIDNKHDADRGYIPTFAKHLVDLASHRAVLADGATSAAEVKRYDPFSVICLNWDLLLDNALDNALLAKDGDPVSDYGSFGVVDYCCYVSSLNKDNRRIRSGLWSLGARGYNVKLLKVHGSMNWLQCPNCQRLFTGFGEKLNIRNEINKMPCRHCEGYGYKIPLRGSLVMPTFLKDLSNFQIKLVWQNAGVEIMEADKLVFIGYSLPHADFEFRQLLSRMVHRDAEIEVVLRGGKANEAKPRYDDFFSGNKLIYPDGNGVQDYVKRIAPPP